MALPNEIANAYNVLTNELPSAVGKYTKTDVLVEHAKKLQRLQTKAGKLRRELKATEQAIREAKRNLKGIAQAIGRGK
jgi:hypothetical protein